MKPVKIHDAKTNFSKLISSVERGEEVVIQRGNTPVAKLVPFQPAGTRAFGALRGQFEMAPDFDEIPADFEEYVR